MFVVIRFSLSIRPGNFTVCVHLNDHAILKDGLR